MELSKNPYNILFLIIISFILLFFIFNWIDYLLSEKFIVECFTNEITEEKMDGSTSHTVDLPLTTTTRGLPNVRIPPIHDISILR